MPKILMIAADYPPCLSAGVQRTYHFAENLLKNGWQPLILSAHPRIYQKLDHTIKVSPEIQKNVRRAFALDVSVHLSIKGKYLGFLEDPDKMAPWFYHGWRVGMSMIKEHEPDVIWSTFPISTAHKIALKLKLKTGKPWVADFRDPLHSHCEENYKNITKQAKTIDEDTLTYADLVVFATQKMRDLYHRAYPQFDGKKLVVIENGYDDDYFENIVKKKLIGSAFTMLYSGALYPLGRDPLPLFKAISCLLRSEKISKANFKLRFRGSGDGVNYESDIAKFNLKDIVEFLPSISFSDSIQEMKNADGLLVLQGRNFNNQIPGKLYEYIATGNPILGLVGKGGATEDLINDLSNGFSVEESDVESIKDAIMNLMLGGFTPNTDYIKYSRSNKASELVELLTTRFI
tara:strand:- start:35 stop:1243 length:1209 start_codon:yes stop_codon:yes gene_type:complete